MTICKKCKHYIGDFGYPHTCCAVETGFPVPKVFINRTSVKCDICGSTAIDHTENQCSINRQLKKAGIEKGGE